MKREFITGLLPDVSKEVLDQIMAEHGKGIEVQKNTITTLTAERDGLKSQLDEASTQIKSYKDMDIEGIKAKASEWEGKYTTETEALKNQLEETKYGYAVQDAVTGIQFSSESAKKAFVADLAAKKLPLQEGKLLGLADFQKAYQESDPAAFLREGGKTPVATRGTGGGQAQPLDQSILSKMSDAEYYAAMKK